MLEPGVSCIAGLLSEGSSVISPKTSSDGITVGSEEDVPEGVFAAAPDVLPETGAVVFAPLVFGDSEGLGVFSVSEDFGFVVRFSSLLAAVVAGAEVFGSEVVVPPWVVSLGVGLAEAAVEVIVLPTWPEVVASADILRELRVSTKTKRIITAANILNFFIKCEDPFDFVYWVRVSICRIYL